MGDATPVRGHGARAGVTVLMSPVGPDRIRAVRGSIEPDLLGRQCRLRRYGGGVASPVWSFPNPVNEKAARTVAAGVAVLTAVVLVTRWWWLTPILALGFLARVLTGPTLSPLGQLATRIVAPRLGPPTEAPGPPKRFAQAIGLAVTTAATVAWFGFGAGPATAALLGLLL